MRIRVVPRALRAGNLARDPVPPSGVVDGAIEQVEGLVEAPGQVERAAQRIGGGVVGESVDGERSAAEGADRERLGVGPPVFARVRRQGRGGEEAALFSPERRRRVAAAPHLSASEGITSASGLTVRRAVANRAACSSAGADSGSNPSVSSRSRLRR